MAPQKLIDYERRRIENIKRNDEMLASLQVHSKINELSAATKRQRVQRTEKKSKTEAPIVVRQSLRTRGMQPDPSTAGGLKDESVDILKVYKLRIKKSPRESGPLSMKDAYDGTTSDRKLIETILGVSNKSHLSSIEGIDGGSCNSIVGVLENENFRYPSRVRGSVDLGSLKLEEKNIARVVPGRILALRFFPSTDMKMISVGNNFGYVGFWNVDSIKEDGDGIYRYHPHSGPVSGIVIQPFCLSKMFTCGYDGFIQLMDVEKEAFDLVYSGDHPIFSVSQRPNDVRSLYFSEGRGRGQLHTLDERAGKSSTSWTLHEDRINTIDFNSENSNIMATSSTDGTVCIWDLRHIDADKPKSLKTVSHKKSVYSAYFSPSGSCLATTSGDDEVGLLSGANYEDTSVIYHYNRKGLWYYTFRAIWGWDDSYIFTSNKKGGVDVISTAERSVVTLESPYVSSIPCRFDAHPYEVGMLAWATIGSHVYLWTSC
ncbi:hypothetical protein F0562_030296 [Nyssa sinensis]|uniref:Uncharacterized protein n=1 Tax=Nyssa sinensis TaxID=561372 RepID=A0A5J5AWJ0_9ASTE|nr:hypothetical protein F0562_030296 [Nyssa sinensis]